MIPIVRVIVYFITFAVSLYSLNAINFAKIIYPKRVVQTQVLVILLAMALAYLVTQFLLGLNLSL
jgi:uncharacterized integral membrane protein (TIGR02327 family)